MTICKPRTELKQHDLNLLYGMCLYTKGTAVMRLSLKLLKFPRSCDGGGDLGEGEFATFGESRIASVL